MLRVGVENRTGSWPIGTVAAGCGAGVVRAGGSGRLGLVAAGGSGVTGAAVVALDEQPAVSSNTATRVRLIA